MRTFRIPERNEREFLDEDGNNGKADISDLSGSPKFQNMAGSAGKTCTIEGHINLDIQS